LGRIYLDGKDVPEDLDKAKYWLKKDAARGDDACYDTDDYLKKVNKKLRERDGLFGGLFGKKK
jgi:TPR repeat protein